jgi:hypothetical protein
VRLTEDGKEMAKVFPLEGRKPGGMSRDNLVKDLNRMGKSLRRIKAMDAAIETLLYQRAKLRHKHNYLVREMRAYVVPKKHNPSCSVTGYSTSDDRVIGRGFTERDGPLAGTIVRDNPESITFIDYDGSEQTMSHEDVYMNCVCGTVRPHPHEDGLSSSDEEEDD